MKYVVAVGNAFDGTVLYGPFDSMKEALQWAETCDNWEVVKITPPHN